jgi:hypothetical protein
MLSIATSFWFRQSSQPPLSWFKTIFFRVDNSNVVQSLIGLPVVKQSSMHMPASTDKGKGRAEPMTEEEAAAAEARQRSFERSLAGPSVGKAGLTRDQVEVNKIIAEASKVCRLRANDLTSGIKVGLRWG